MTAKKEKTKMGKSVWITMNPELQAIALIDKAMDILQYDNCGKERVFSYAIGKHFGKGTQINHSIFFKHGTVRPDFTE